MISSLDHLFKTGSAIETGITNLLNSANGIADDIYSMVNSTTIMVDDVNRAINETAKHSPEITEHINESLRRLESALLIFGIASALMLCICVFLCIFNIWAQYQLIYSTKKVLIVNSNVPRNVQSNVPRNPPPNVPPKERQNDAKTPRTSPVKQRSKFEMNRSGDLIPVRDRVQSNISGKSDNTDFPVEYYN